MDDQHIRHNQFRLRHPEWRTTSAFGAAEAIQAMETGTFDIIHLDHDLGEYDKEGNELDGMTVVNWMVEHWEKRPQKSKPLIIVHSWNHAGAVSMVEELRRVGFDARKERFSP